MTTKTLNYLFLFNFLLLTTVTYAQHKLCGHHLVLQNMEANYPGYKEAVNRTFETAKQIGKTNRLNRSSDVYTIPVVVHVVWKDSLENIPDSLITSQIEVLNEDYRRLNADADNIRPIFEEVVDDAMIEFELIDIIRVQTTEDFQLQLTGGLPDNVKVAAEGGSDAINTETHLNIWVCHIQPVTIAGLTLGQILGYAYPPAGLAHWPEDVAAPSPELDGVVIDYRVVGRDNPNEIDLGLGMPLNTKGRTATHEVGHYLGLRHTWGDGGDLFGLLDSCGEDDGVDDTPNTGSQANFDCDNTRNSCDDGIDDLPDMIENFMDYASEDCMNSFTKGQIDILRGVLESERCMLVGACDATAVSTINQSYLLTAFPNPTAHTLTLQLDNYNLADFDVKMQGILGESIDIPLVGNTMDLSTLSSGIYVLTLRKDNIQMVKKISVLK